MESRANTYLKEEIVYPQEKIFDKVAKSAKKLEQNLKLFNSLNAKKAVESQFKTSINKVEIMDNLSRWIENLK